MKILSLNVEGRRFLDNGLLLCSAEDPDVICLLEAPEQAVATLTRRGYQVTFAPMVIKNFGGVAHTEGVLVATTIPHNATIHYYYPLPTIVAYSAERKRDTVARPVIVVTTSNYTVAATHFTWNPHGDVADEYQVMDMEKLRSFLVMQPAHVLCGDFNIPRFKNKLYEVLTKLYIDTVPLQYQSSLDKDRHHLGVDPTYEHLFTGFMVDYIFTQPPYVATTTRLQFGISDHAAVIAEIEVPLSHVLT